VSDDRVIEYCRQVEAHLTRVNGGHLVRIVGPGFALVRSWESDGVPLSVVTRAIDEKAERHRHGASKRPLRIEFCETDVRELFEQWKRAIGAAASESQPSEAPAPSVSLSRHLDRVADRLSRLLGREDLPQEFLDRVSQIIADVSAARERARTARGPARAEIAALLPPLDRALLAAARDVPDAPLRDQLQRDAERDLNAFKTRLPPAAWEAAVDATVDRLLRDRLALPTIAIDVF
jgi:hypothetical protein